jgi:hypothetical protein
MRPVFLCKAPTGRDSYSPGRSAAQARDTRRHPTKNPLPFGRERVACDEPVESGEGRFSPRALPPPAKLTMMIMIIVVGRF